MTRRWILQIFQDLFLEGLCIAHVSRVSYGVFLRMIMLVVDKMTKVYRYLQNIHVLEEEYSKLNAGARSSNCLYLCGGSIVNYKPSCFLALKCFPLHLCRQSANAVHQKMLLCIMHLFHVTNNIDFFSVFVTKH